MNIEQLKDEGFTIQQINQLIPLIESGLDISYLGPELLNLNLLRFLKKEINQFTVAQKQLILHGISKKLNVTFYMKHVLSEKQMEMIIMGLEKELDVSFYADPKFNLVQMREIKNLLEYNKVKNTNLDVSKIAKARYSANQMYEIKAGLVNGIDTTLYERPDLDSDQMQLIRIALEKGLDISIFEKDDYPIEEMRKFLNKPYKNKILKLFNGIKRRKNN